jgi:hypothetical protein
MTNIKRAGQPLVYNPIENFIEVLSLSVGHNIHGVAERDPHYAFITQHSCKERRQIAAVREHQPCPAIDSLERVTLTNDSS